MFYEGLSFPTLECTYATPSSKCLFPQSVPLDSPGRRAHHICRSRTTCLRLCLLVCAFTPLTLGHWKRCRRARSAEGSCRDGCCPLSGLGFVRYNQHIPCTPGTRHKHENPPRNPPASVTLKHRSLECAPLFLSLLPQIFTEHLLCARHRPGEKARRKAGRACPQEFTVPQRRQWGVCDEVQPVLSHGDLGASGEPPNQAWGGQSLVKAAWKRRHLNSSGR